MIDIWDSIEADFQRDYGINLSIELDNMSWRRFNVLMNNLSPFGAVSAALDGSKTKVNSEDENESKLQADSFFDAIASLK